MKYLYISIFCLLLWSCIGESATAPKNLSSTHEAINDFDVAQSKWHAHNISRYKIHIFRDTIETSNKANGGAGNITSNNSLVLVDQEQVLESYQLSRKDFLDYEWQTLNVQAALTVEELFMMIEHALANEALVGHVNYHEYGYPLDFQYLDNDSNFVNIHVESFEAPETLTTKLNLNLNATLASSSINAPQSKKITLFEM